LLPDYPAAFRQRVLRRVAEKDDLEGTAREFGVSAELVFQWRRQDADGREPGAPAAGSIRKGPTSTSPDRARRASRGDWAEVVSIHAALLLPTLLLFAVGHVRPSGQAERACWPAWIAIWVALFAWQVRASNRRLEASDIDLAGTRRLGIAVLFAVLSGLSTWILALALPAIPHRLTGKAIDVRTIVTDKSVRRGKGTSYCLSTPAFDPRIAPVQWCTDRRTFEQAREGETIVLHGTTSWFGFMPGHFELLPSTPAGASALAEALPAVPLSPPMAPGGSVRFQASPQVSGVARKTVDPGTVARPGQARPPLDDETLRAWPGDDLATIRVAYPGSPSPTPFHSSDAANQQLLSLQDHGLRFFLTSGGTINTVRLDRPFAGSVGGVRLGDRLDEARRNLGSPGRDLGGRPQAALGSSVLFETGARYRIRLDLDADQRVRTIFLLR
jgi:transposase-like protein